MPTHWVGSSVELAAKLNLLGKSPAFRTLLEQIHRFAGCDATILIHGETGTGKELAARAMHYLSARRARPFIPLNCGCMPDTLIGSELFGHSRGAFTDAREAREGLVAQAEGGTLFFRDFFENLENAPIFGERLIPAICGTQFF
jgi:DNA-binding NtrC family response regulator